jgi:GntR family histidine utilization transcriptional repressor
MHEGPTRHISRSLHARIRADIEERILSGEWSPGHRIPPEKDFMQRWDCSRMTVNNTNRPVS